jgi:DNA polymerase-3 subunit epsilon
MSPALSSIVEIGAIKVQGGEVTGTFHSLVDPGREIPPFIWRLTGLSDESVAGAPRVGAVLPSFLEFVRGTVLIAHNARFDASFLNHALCLEGYESLDNPILDTVALARRVLADDEVPNRRLETLALHFRTANAPCHRAFADVLATVDLLHALIERAAGFEVFTLEGLIRLTAPRRPRRCSPASSA